ncbi:hypothetical protein ACIP6P_03985 [Streptomyces sp. NPDC088729]|uniref:hypothetical protein n=1 Tax=unclassified Streptomyces TaxID=2593676 RepID=UPI000F551DDF|nr:hypothetical protein [Streptomyces sp. ADI96-02]
MNPYDRQQQPRNSVPPAPDGGTPIFDRLLAEWRAAGRQPRPDAPREPVPEHEPVRPCETGFVPAARTSQESAGT